MSTPDRQKQISSDKFRSVFLTIFPLSTILNNEHVLERKEKMIEIKEVATRRQRKAFVEFPLKLYKGNPYFVPPLYADEMKIFRADYHYYDDSEAVYYLAYRDGKIVGRISGILHYKSNEKWKQKRVRFTRFDCIDDQEVANALFGAVEAWAKRKGMEEVVGPLGFSDLEREGLLIEGFEELSTFEEQYNYPYYQRLIENLGYEKEVDWIEHKLYPPKTPDTRIKELREKVLKRYDLHMSDAKNSREFIKRYQDDFFRLLDDTYAEIYGTVPFTEKMKKELIKNFRIIIDVKHIAMLLDKEEHPVCFGLCFPSIAMAVKKSDGHLTLPTIFRILKSVKKPKIIDLALVGVVPAYRGASLVMIDEIMRMLTEGTAEYLETNLNLEDNYSIHNMWKSFECVQHKRRRAFVKKI